MVRSMTGFGRGEASDDQRQVTVEIKSINHRYGDISVKLPRAYSFAEDALKRVVRAGVSRGKTDVIVNVISSAEDDSAVFVNMLAAKQYFKELRDLQRSFDVTGDISLSLLAGMPDVLRTETGNIDEDKALAVMTAAVEAAVLSLNGMRTAEGAKLAADMSMRATAIDQATYGIEELLINIPDAYAERLRNRIGDLLEGGDVSIAEDRIAVEVAVLADKSDVTEEIVRLRSHTEQFQDMLSKDSGEPIGKKLDFLTQEMNREANTIGSKASDLGVTRAMLDIKNEVEKIREQVQNIE